MVKSRYLVLWFSAQTPNAMLFYDKEAAKTMASDHNALLIEVSGKVLEVVDYYRRNEQGKPLPATWL